MRVHKHAEASPKNTLDARDPKPSADESNMPDMNVDISVDMLIGATAPYCFRYQSYDWIDGESCLPEEAPSQVENNGESDSTMPELVDISNDASDITVDSKRYNSHPIFELSESDKIWMRTSDKYPLALMQDDDFAQELYSQHLRTLGLLYPRSVTHDRFSLGQLGTNNSTIGYATAAAVSVAGLAMVGLFAYRKLFARTQAHPQPPQVQLQPQGLPTPSTSSVAA